MKANELRIGNLFNPNNPVKLEWWMLNPELGIAFNPIPLTEEWFLELGCILQKGEITDTYHLESGCYTLSIYKSDNGFHILLSDGGMYIGLGIKKYVHQLQNLYFDLTGEELELK